jgi:hypothetical protein
VPSQGWTHSRRLANGSAYGLYGVCCSTDKCVKPVQLRPNPAPARLGLLRCGDGRCDCRQRVSGPKDRDSGHVTAGDSSLTKGSEGGCWWPGPHHLLPAPAPASSTARWPAPPGHAGRR